jgi:hypothetical protein
MICRNTTFTFFNRKHHCRSCGRVICSDCSEFHDEKTLSSSDGASEKVRTCKECFLEIQAIEQDHQEDQVFDDLMNFQEYEGIEEGE